MNDNKSRGKVAVIALFYWSQLFARILIGIDDDAWADCNDTFIKCYTKVVEVSSGEIEKNISNFNAKRYFSYYLMKYVYVLLFIDNLFFE